MRRLLVGGSRKVRAAVASTAWLLAFLAAPVSAQNPTPRLTVRVYDAFGLTPFEMRTAAAAFERVFAAADVPVVWRACRLNGPDPCSDALGASEIVIRLLRGPQQPSPGTAPPLGYSSIRAPQPGTIATVYPDRVRSLARRARREDGEVLGQAMAHEAGHLVLGTNTHPRAGLMRAQWTARSLETAHPADGLFLPTEGRRIRTAVAARLQHSAADAVWTAAALRIDRDLPADR